MIKKSKDKPVKVRKLKRNKRASKYVEREDGKVLCPSCTKKGGEKWVERNTIKFGMCEACRDDLHAKYEPVIDKAAGVGKKALGVICVSLATAAASAFKRKG